MSDLSRHSIPNQHNKDVRFAAAVVAFLTVPELVLDRLLNILDERDGLAGNVASDAHGIWIPITSRDAYVRHFTKKATLGLVKRELAGE